jgi:hypothetical protein
MSDNQKAEEYCRRVQELAGWPISLETYRLGDVYHCTISSVDPGARFAQAEQRALEKAERYLVKTRRRA